MNNKRKIYFIPHTHWDREWYFSQDDASVLSTMSFLKAIETLEENKNYPCYNLDAQTSIVEDMLVLRPDLKDRLAKLVKEKRIYIGPWYTQTDTFYADGESIIRNLYFGIKDAKKMGRTMRIGYLPDTFGHNIQMPQIFKGFNIDNIIFWRGYNPKKTPSPFFNWKGKDGTSILAANITFGYSGLRYNIIKDEKNFDSKFISMADKLVKSTKETNLFLPLGGDQELINETLIEDVDKLNQHTKKLNKDYEFYITDYENYLKKLKEEIGDLSNLQIFEEELRDPVKARVHRTIGSSRYDIKKKSFELENKLVNILEPLTVIFKEKIDKNLVNQNILERAWKFLLDGHAHDSLGACNTDITNTNVMNRFQRASDLIDGLINILQKTLGINIKSKFDKTLVVYNFETKNLINAKREITLYSRNPKINIFDGNNEIKFDYLSTIQISGGKLVTHTSEGDKEQELPPYYKHRLLLNLNMKSFGYKALKVNEVESKYENNYVNNDKAENDDLLLTIENNDLHLLNKKDNIKYEKFISFENIGNDGDSYDFSPMRKTTPINKYIISNSRVKNVSSKIVEFKFDVTMSVPFKAISRTERSKETVDLKFEFTALLINNKINFNIKVINSAKDHRVRVLFNMFKDKGKVITDIPFGFMERKYVKEPDNWNEFMVEKPVNYFPIINTFYKEHLNKQFIINTKGIKEIEIDKNNLVYLTLWKSDEYLGKDDLEFRPNRASGMNNKIIKTPDAQLFDKELEFDFQIILDENLSEKEIFDLKREYIPKFSSYQVQEFDVLSQNLERWSFPIKQYNVKDELSILPEINDFELISSYVSFYDEKTVLRYLNLSDEDKDAHLLKELTKKEVIDFEENKLVHKDNISKYKLVTLK